MSEGAKPTKAEALASATKLIETFQALRKEIEDSEENEEMPVEGDSSLSKSDANAIEFLEGTETGFDLDTMIMKTAVEHEIETRKANAIKLIWKRLKALEAKVN